MLILILLTSCLASLEDDSSTIIQLLNVAENLIISTSSINLSEISEHLSALSKDIQHAEDAVTSLENIIESLEQSHENFNTTEAMIIRKLASDMLDLIEKIDSKVRSIGMDNVKQLVPKAIVGLATADTQAANSVAKIKQECDKLDSTIGSNSKFVWIWVIIAVSVVIPIGIIFTITGASKSNI